MTEKREPQELRMSLPELIGLPVTVDLVTAGRAFGIGRTKAYEMAQGKASEPFPCEVLPVGRFYRVRKVDLMRELGLDINGNPLPTPETQAGAA